MFSFHYPKLHLKEPNKDITYAFYFFVVLCFLYFTLILTTLRNMVLPYSYFANQETKVLRIESDLPIAKIIQWEQAWNSMPEFIFYALAIYQIFSFKRMNEKIGKKEEGRRQNG